MERQLTAVIETLRGLCDTYDQGGGRKCGICLAQLYNDYLKSIEGKGSPRAFASKVNLSKKIIADIGQLDVLELDFETLSRYVNSWTTRTYYRVGQDLLYSQSHIDKVYNNLSCVLRYGVDKGIIHKNLMERIECPTSRRFEDEEVASMEEWELQEVMLSHIARDDIMAAYWYTLKVLLLYTGARPGEVFAFSFTDFDYSANTVKFRRALSLDVLIDTTNMKRLSSKPYFKNLKNEINGRRDYARRRLSVSSFAINTVLWYKRLLESNSEVTNLRRQQKTSNYLFAWPLAGQIKRPDYYCNAYRNHLLENNIDPSQYNMYRFRHTFCTRLFKLHKLDPKTVQLLMGDNSMDMVMRVYHSVNKDDLLMASNNYSQELDRFIERAQGRAIL